MENTILTKDFNKHTIIIYYAGNYSSLIVSFYVVVFIKAFCFSPIIYFIFIFSAAIMFIVRPDEVNVYVQRILEYRIRDK